MIVNDNKSNISSDDAREENISRSGALRAFYTLRAQAAANGTNGMTLDEINEEIRRARKGIDE